MALADELEVSKRKGRIGLLKKIGFTVALIGSFGLFLSLVNRADNHRQAYRKTLFEADINRDKMVDHQEWTGVYKSLGMIYDIMKV